MDQANAKRIATEIRKRFRSDETEEVSDNKRPKKLTESELNDFFELLDSGYIQDKSVTMPSNSNMADMDDISFLNKLEPLFIGLETRLGNKIDALEDKLKLKDQKITQLEEKVDLLEHKTKVNNLRIHGIPESETEPTEAILIKTIKDTLNIEIDPKDLDDTFRLGKSEESPKPRPILVKFVRNKDRRRVYTAKKELKNNSSKIYINEDLTKKTSDFYKTDRTLQKEGYIWKTWTTNGSIFFTHNTHRDTPININTDEEIEKIRQSITPRTDRNIHSSTATPRQNRPLIRPPTFSKPATTRR
jgi:hypothetical protein